MAQDVHLFTAHSWQTRSGGSRRKSRAATSFPLVASGDKGPPGAGGGLPDRRTEPGSQPRSGRGSSPQAAGIPWCFGFVLFTCSPLKSQRWEVTKYKYFVVTFATFL